jgi:hypothetical protein
MLLITRERWIDSFNRVSLGPFVLQTTRKILLAASKIITLPKQQECKEPSPAKMKVTKERQEKRLRLTVALLPFVDVVEPQQHQQHQQQNKESILHECLPIGSKTKSALSSYQLTCVSHGDH